jgi:hypothetical protein
MQNVRSLSRAEFLRLTFGGAAAALTFAACGGGATPQVDAAPDDVDAGGGSPDAAGGPDAAPGSPDATPASCLDDGGVVAIGGNHGHALTVSVADIEAAVDKTYDIQGDSGHNHTVTLTAAHFAMLADGTSIQVTSSNAGHIHSVTVSCG